MEKTIAVLRVVIDSNCPGSRLQTHSQSGPQGEQLFTLRMCPPADSAILKDAHSKLTKRNFVSIFTHEMGHFVARVLNLPSHRLPTFLESDREILKGEQDAWSLAEKMIPGVKDSDAYQKSIHSYTPNE